jgi:hypothetical protein
MVYPGEIVRADVGSVFFPKLLGSYEVECHAFVERICSRACDRIVNIGAGEGYYAVGLARRLPKAHVIAFETDPYSRQLCSRLAELNGVQSRVEIRGACDRDALAASLIGKCVVVSDCEGAELDLLVPEKVPGLVQTTLLVELHDFVTPGTSSAIGSRFEETHTLERRQSCERDPAEWPILENLSARQHAALISEYRPCAMEWLFAEPAENRTEIQVARGDLVPTSTRG